MRVTSIPRPLFHVTRFIMWNVTDNQAIIPDVITDPAAREKEQLREGEYDDNEETCLSFIVV